MTAPGPAPDRAAAAELPARDAARCGCADAERTYEQLWDHAWETGQELDRWKNLAEGWHKHHNEALDARDAARAERDQARAELDRQRALIAAVLAACSEAEAVAGWNTARVTVAEIRALLGGDGR